MILNSTNSFAKCLVGMLSVHTFENNSRIVIKNPGNVTCPVLFEEELCDLKRDCNCAYEEWGKWGECSAECAGGNMTRYRVVLQGRN